MPSACPCVCVCVCVCVYVCVCMLSCVWLFCDPMDCSPPVSSVHGILQARILEWVAMSSSRGSSRLGNWTMVSCISCIADGFFTTESSRKMCLLSLLPWSQKPKDSLWRWMSLNTGSHPSLSSENYIKKKKKNKKKKKTFWLCDLE